MEAIFLDIEMPQMDGIEIGRIIKKIHPKCKIIMAADKEERIKEAFQIEALRFISKPFEYLEVEGAIKALYKQRLGTESIGLALLRFIRGAIIIKNICKYSILKEGSPMNIVQTINLKKHYGNELNITKALDGIDVTIEKGEFVAIVGTSGSGKTTLLNIMGGLDAPTSGRVIVQEQELSDMSDNQLTIFRRRNIGFIFQNYNLVPILNVYENIVLPLELDGKDADKKYLEIILRMLSLEDKIRNLPNSLSGGQQQRVAIARALITKPAIVLADEPTGNLDSKTSADVLDLLKITSSEFNQTIIMITHNTAIGKFADRIIQIEDGRIVNQGDKHDSIDI